MLTALACDNWTIFSTLTTGAVLGFFILLGGVALIIHSEIKARRFQQSESPTQPRLTVLQQVQEVLYDHEKHGI